MTDIKDITDITPEDQEYLNGLIESIKQIDKKIEARTFRDEETKQILRRLYEELKQELKQECNKNEERFILS